MTKFKIVLAILVLVTIVAIGLTVYAATAPTNENPEIWVTPALPENIRQIAPIPAWAAVGLGWLSVGAVVVRRRKHKTL